MMGTRSGDIDATVIFHLVNQLGYDINQVDNLLNKKSGLLGLVGSSDMRDVKNEIVKGNPDAILAYEMYAYRIKKYIGAYAAAMGGLDAVVFTGGIGENDNKLRELVLTGLDFLNLHLDTNLNNQSSKEIRAINTTTSTVQALVIPTNEELEIALQCYTLLNV
jgi:acetate kinase